MPLLQFKKAFSLKTLRSSQSKHTHTRPLQMRPIDALLQQIELTLSLEHSTAKKANTHVRASRSLIWSPTVQLLAGRRSGVNCWPWIVWFVFILKLEKVKRLKTGLTIKTLLLSWRALRMALQMALETNAIATYHRMRSSVRTLASGFIRFRVWNFSWKLQLEVALLALNS